MNKSNKSLLKGLMLLPKTKKFFERFDKETEIVLNKEIPLVTELLLHYVFIRRDMHFYYFMYDKEFKLVPSTVYIPSDFPTEPICQTAVNKCFLFIFSEICDHELIIFKKHLARFNKLLDTYIESLMSMKKISKSNPFFIFSSGLIQNDSVHMYHVKKCINFHYFGKPTIIILPIICKNYSGEKAIIDSFQYKKIFDFENLL